MLATDGPEAITLRFTSREAHVSFTRQSIYLSFPHRTLRASAIVPQSRTDTFSYPGR